MFNVVEVVHDALERDPVHGGKLVVNGFKKFDFGRSTPGEGTYNFKKQWGAKPIQLSWQYQFNGSNRMPELNTKNPKYKMAIKIWKKLPLAVTIFLGPRIVKNIP